MKTMEIKRDLEDRRRGIERRLAAIESDLSKQLDADSDDRAIETENDEVLTAMERSGREGATRSNSQRNGRLMPDVLILGAGWGGIVVAYEMKEKIRPETCIIQRLERI